MNSILSVSLFPTGQLCMEGCDGMDRRKRIAKSAAATEAIQDIEKVDPSAKVPYISDESVEAARNWVNEHEL